MSNGNMEQKQQSDTSQEASRLFSGRVRARVSGEAEEYRDVGKYSYRLVYAQESLRLLDLRLDIGELQDVDSIGELLDAFGRRILENAIVFSVEQLGGTFPRGIVRGRLIEEEE